eukprot:Platyproteum_vivax@DN1400_c0_g1_i1.p1
MCSISMRESSENLPIQLTASQCKRVNALTWSNHFLDSEPEGGEEICEALGFLHPAAGHRRLNRLAPLISDKFLLNATKGYAQYALQQFGIFGLRFCDFVTLCRDALIYNPPKWKRSDLTDIFYKHINLSNQLEDEPIMQFSELLLALPRLSTLLNTDVITLRFVICNARLLRDLFQSWLDESSTAAPVVEATSPENNFATPVPFCCALQELRQPMYLSSVCMFDVLSPLFAQRRQEAVLSIEAKYLASKERWGLTREDQQSRYSTPVKREGVHSSSTCCSV